MKQNLKGLEAKCSLEMISEMFLMGQIEINCGQPLKKIGLKILGRKCLFPYMLKIENSTLIQTGVLWSVQNSSHLETQWPSETGPSHRYYV